MLLYFDSAATSLLKPESIYDAVLDAMKNCGGSGRGAHDAALYAARTVFRTRSAVAEFFGCGDVNRVAFSLNATESLNAAIFGLLDQKDHVISTVTEHNSVLRPLYYLKELGMGLDLVPVDEKGVLDYEAFGRLLRRNTRAVVCSHASNLTGNYNDMAWISRFCKEHDLLLIVDAAQTAGSAKIDMDAMGIDVLCFTGHKSLLGPQGTGGLVVRKGLSIRPFKRGGTGIHSFLKSQPEEMPEALEAGTQNAHGLAGLCAGIAYLQREGLASVRQQERAVSMRFYEGIREIPGVMVYGDYAMEKRAPIVSLNIGDRDSGSVSDYLSREHGICTRPGAHCAPLMHEAFHTVKQGMVRFSFSHRNTQEEVDRAIEAIRICAQ
ncbi:aminotransferase class V-fold PLP-dependent enzyme [Christensenellaceae bacterium OttesenSCG-928-M15]|nr:aminotransferase class V-fold PLP-dependent enzyme [Christensenellaceae bacterium OttesenSCG-928-M15]